MASGLFAPYGKGKRVIVSDTVYTCSVTDSRLASVPVPCKKWSQIGLEVSQDDLSRAEPLFLSEHSSRRILKLESMVVKCGADLDISEIASMSFIQRHTTIPVPKILNAYENEGCKYILMEYIEGEKLSTAWPQLSPSERSCIGSELRDILRQIRNIVPPPGHIGSVTGGPAVDRRSLGAVKGGPFSTEKKFNEWQLAQLHEDTPLANRDMYTNAHKTDHRIVFSHGDLGPHNILVRNGHIVAILDWEYSGWYPEHWDFCKSIHFVAGTEEHYLLFREAFSEPYMSEYCMDLWFTREVKHGGW